MSAEQFAENPYRFMQDNVVKVAAAPELPVGGENILRVYVERTAGTIENKDGGGVYLLWTGEGDNAIDAYWCPYKANNANDDFEATMIGNRANYMFTADMTGCTLGVGSQTGDGNVRVAHANAATVGNESHRRGARGAADLAADMDRQTNAQIERLQGIDIGHFISYQHYMLNTAQALDLQIHSTTFGMHRIGKAWAFFTHRWKFLGGGRYQHFGIDYVVGGRWGTW